MWGSKDLQMNKADPLTPHKVQNNILKLIFICTHILSHRIQRTTFKSQHPSPTTWVLKMELGPLDSEASAFTLGTISVAPK